MKKFLLILGIVLAAVIPTINAQDVYVGMYILNLGRFDVATGQFTADFYLSMKCEQTCSSTNFEFMNGRAASVDKIIDKPNEKFFRIQANLNSPVDLKKYPFDSQKMQIIIEDKENTLDKIRYVPLRDESGIDKAIFFTGWNIDGWKADTKIHEYPVYNETYSQYVFSVDISRIKANSFIKTFLPVIIIVLIVLGTFVMDPDKIVNRITLVSSSFIAAVMFHVTISNQIPPVGYLTFADKFMILTYFVMLVAFGVDIVILELSERKMTELLEKVHRATEYSMFVVVPLLYVNLLLVYLI